MLIKMSGNIYDTNVTLIKTQISNLISDLNNYSKTSRNISIYENSLQNKYNYLFTTSKTLFNMIFNAFKNNKFDQEYFNVIINKMLNHITQIQNKEISQYDASVNIGTDLAHKYIPQLKESVSEIKNDDDNGDGDDDDETNEN
jgi:hypothetical protein